MRRHGCQRKLRRTRINPNRLEDPEVDVDDVSRFARRVHPFAAGIVNVGVEESRQPFPRVAGVETDHLRRARQPRDDGGFDQPLQIDRDIVAGVADAANGAPETTRRHRRRCDP